MITVSLADLQSRLDEVYASQHTGRDGAKAAALVYRRNICSPLPPASVGPVVDLGCGRGGLVRLPQADGFDAEASISVRSRRYLPAQQGCPGSARGTSGPFAPRIRLATQITVRRLL